MHDSELLKQAEAHLQQAETELHSAEAAERLAEHNVAVALEELHEVEDIREHEIFLDIATPKGAFRGIFTETATVAAVIAKVVDEKKLDPKDTFELFHGETQLQPTSRTLESFGLKHKAKLELVAQGSGV